MTNHFHYDSLTPNDFWFCIKYGKCGAKQWGEAAIWRIICPECDSNDQTLLCKKIGEIIKRKREKGKKKRTRTSDLETETSTDLDSSHSTTSGSTSASRTNVVEPPGTIFENNNNANNDNDIAQDEELSNMLANMLQPDHEELQQRIRNARTVDEFNNLYVDMDIIFQRVHGEQMAFGNVWNWCVGWAVQRFKDSKKSWSLEREKDRKTSLLLLEYLWRRYEPDVEDGRPDFKTFKTLSKYDVVKHFGTEKIDRILGMFLPMDRANCFYKMTPPGASVPGFSWYSKVHTDLDKYGVTPNASGKGLLNRRYVLLTQLCNQYLEEEKGLPPIGKFWIHWMEPAMPPLDRYRILGIPDPSIDWTLLQSDDVLLLPSTV